MIGKKLKDLIRNRGIRQIKLARFLGISPSRLSNYLSDKREPDLEMLSKMAKYLEVDLNYFSNTFYPQSVEHKRSSKATFELKPIDEDEFVVPTVNIPYIAINSKKRLGRKSLVPVPVSFVESVENPEENALLCEVTTKIGGIHFKNGDVVLSAKCSAVKDKSGKFVFETGRNGKAFRYLEKKDYKFLVSEDNSEVVNITSDEELERYHALLWVFSRH
ncbi:MAG: helix-turn-helix domain-containing protein [Deferribacteraceae bacterium]|jgi:transcriptional regulator with XRE-family HTH domain|nr:helix-turn-helix domain-containing protein [Deferribacteraceae bacterium]